MLIRLVRPVRSREIGPMTTTLPNLTSLRPTDSSPADSSPRASHFVLGGDHVGLAIAERLQADGNAVTVVDDGYDAADVPGVAGCPTDVELLAESGLEAASTVIVATRSDARNFLVAQLVRAHFDVPRVVILTHDPDRLSSLAAAGHEPFCVPTALSEAVTERT